MNRTVALALAALYSILLILLTCMDLYLIGNYQRNRRRADEELLGGYVQQIGEDMEEINTILYDIYANNSYFHSLGGSLPALQEFDQVYGLDHGLRNRIILEGKLHGYIIFYHSNESARYYMEPALIPAEDMRRMKEIIGTLIETDAGSWQWSFQEINESRYGMLPVRRNGAAVCMVYSFRQTERGLYADAAQGSKIFLADNYSLLGNMPEGFAERELREKISHSENRFQCYAGGYWIYGQKVKNSDLWVCMAVPVTLFSYMNIPQIFLLILTACSLAGAYLLFRYMRRELVLPLRDMISVMRRIQEGEWDAQMDQEVRFEEIQKVNAALTAMVSEIKKQKMLSYEQTIEKQKAQMQYLQLQLKPHFYLNGLKTLYALTLSGDNERMQDLIIHLSYHLRYLLQAEREMVALESEIDYVKNYAKLQKDLADRAVNVVWSVQDALRAWSVPNLCIQTFVENSFKYAKVASLGRRLVVQISVNELDTEEGCFLDICVRDNGEGYPESVLEEINSEPEEGSVSVGINNLKRRCRFLYGSSVQYAFYNEGGAVSELMLPWTRRGGGDEDTDRG